MDDIERELDEISEFCQRNTGRDFGVGVLLDDSNIEEAGEETDEWHDCEIPASEIDLVGAALNQSAFDESKIQVDDATVNAFYTSASQARRFERAHALDQQREELLSEACRAAANFRCDCALLCGLRAKVDGANAFALRREVLNTPW